jgi:hypothetical protein
MLLHKSGRHSTKDSFNAKASQLENVFFINHVYWCIKQEGMWYYFDNFWQACLYYDVFLSTDKYTVPMGGVMTLTRDK